MTDQSPNAATDQPVSIWLGLGGAGSRLKVLDRDTIPTLSESDKDFGHSGDAGSSHEHDGMRICVLEPDPEQLRSVAAVLRTMGHQILPIDQVIGASNQIRSFHPDLLITEAQTPTLSGPALMQVLRRNLPDMPTLIIYSNFDPDQLAIIARQAGAADFVTKHEGIAVLASKVRYHHERIRKGLRHGNNGE